MGIVKAGSVLIVESGEYSDKVWSGPLRVLKDFDQGVVLSRVKKEFKPVYEGQDASPSDVVPWLVANGFVEDFPNAVGWFVGAYYLSDADVHDAA